MHLGGNRRCMGAPEVPEIYLTVVRKSGNYNQVEKYLC